MASMDEKSKEMKELLEKEKELHHEFHDDYEKISRRLMKILKKSKNQNLPKQIS